jgi:hypothetical protein
MRSLCRKPRVEGKVVWDVDAALARAHVFTCIKQELEAALVDVAYVCNRYVLQ